MTTFEARAEHFGAAHVKKKKYRDQNPDADLKHYCRRCEESFETDGKDSAHRQARIHFIRDHEPEAQYERCNRYCEMRSQHEEVVAGEKLYGVGSVRPEPTEKGAYKRLFPEERDGV